MRARGPAVAALILAAAGAVPASARPAPDRSPAVAVASAAGVPDAPAVRPRLPLETILQDDAQLLHRPRAQLEASLDSIQALGVDRIRVTAGWSTLTRAPDDESPPAFDATDPAAYEQARFEALDRLVRLAHERGLEVMIDIGFWAPRWASSDAPGERGRTGIDMEAFGRFATAIARRYDGSFVVPADHADPGDGRDANLLEEFFGGEDAGGPDAASSDALPGPLPEVDVFTVWNEPNHPAFLRPQWTREDGEWVPESPGLYRAMLQAAYPAVKRARPDAKVLIGGLASTGAYRRKGANGVPPLQFLRELACVDADLEPIRRGGCATFAGPVPGDGWSVHPYSMQTTPGTPSSPGRYDDVKIAELSRLARLLHRLAAQGLIARANRDLWITEYGYETNPPVRGHRFSPADQAKFLPWAEYLAWRVPRVRSFAQFLLRDLPPGTEWVGNSKKRPFGQWQSGLLFDDGRPKPAAKAFLAGLVVTRAAGHGGLVLWGRMRTGPGDRDVRVEFRAEGRPWRALRTTTSPNAPLRTRFTTPGDRTFLRLAPAPSGDGLRFRLRYTRGRRTVVTPVVTLAE